jgi:hypothetical protein
LEKLSQVPLILIVVGYVAMSGALVWSFVSPKEPSVAPVEQAVDQMEDVSPCPPSAELIAECRPAPTQG